MGEFATGVTVVTSLDAGRPVGFTCQSGVSLSLEPPLVALAPAKSSTSWPRMAEAGHFCVNVLSERQEEVGRRFAVSGGDKFPGIAWRKEVTGAPVLDGALAWVDCDLELVHDAGDHEIVIGRVRGVLTPTTVAIGTTERGWTPGSLGPAIADALPHGRLDRHPLLGHFGPLQGPATVGAMILDALF